MSKNNYCNECFYEHAPGKCKNNQPDLDEIFEQNIIDEHHYGTEYDLPVVKKTILAHYIAKQDAIKAFEKYLDTYYGDYTDKDIERFKLILERIDDESTKKPTD